MVNVKEEISEAKAVSGMIAYSYSKAATYGHETEEQYFDLLRINAYIETLERQKSKFYVTDCITEDIEPCLSDEEMCKITEMAKKLCFKYK